MSPDTISPGAISARGLWKRFPADRIKRDLRDHVRHMREHGVRRGWRWALRDIDLDVEPGEALGLLGANGSGKTTLLRLLIGVTDPYAGRVRIGGRVGALLEVKAGIHPELTGRENVYLYGTLLGLKRREVTRRFDDIVAFAELEDAIDRQVKFYSSGMQMRLGFAVSAFLDPDILIVDEVLAVGDATFQQRCLDRMRAVLDQGTTLVFVSHDLAAVENTCDRGLWLNDGVLAAEGPMPEVLTAYRRWIEATSASTELAIGDVNLLKARVTGPEGGTGTAARSFQPLDIDLVVASDEPRPVRVCIGISEGTASPTIFLQREAHLAPGETGFRCHVESLPLPRGRYYLWVGVFGNHRDLLPWHPTAAFDVDGPQLDKTPSGIVRLAPVHVDARWEHDRR